VLSLERRRHTQPVPLLPLLPQPPPRLRSIDTRPALSPPLLSPPLLSPPLTPLPLAHPPSLLIAPLGPATHVYAPVCGVPCCRFSPVACTPPTHARSPVEGAHSFAWFPGVVTGRGRFGLWSRTWPTAPPLAGTVRCRATSGLRCLHTTRTLPFSLLFSSPPPFYRAHPARCSPPLHVGCARAAPAGGRGLGLAGTRQQGSRHAARGPSASGCVSAALLPLPSSPPLLRTPGVPGWFSLGNPLTLTE
jgi:hypothetical protein